MKKLSLVVCVLVLGLTAFAGDSTLVASTSKCIHAATDLGYAPAFIAHGTNAVGDTVKSGGSYYLCVTAGNSTNAGPVGSGDVTCGSTVWRHIPNLRRDGLYIGNVNSGDTPLWVSFNSAAVAGSGIRIAANTGLIFDQGYSGAVYAVTTNPVAATTVITEIW